LAVHCRKQFPAFPTTTPVIPAWQLQQNVPHKSVDADGVETLTEMKSPTTELENSENLTDSKSSSQPVAADCGERVISQQMIDSLPDHTQQIIQVNTSFKILKLKYLKYQNTKYLNRSNKNTKIPNTLWRVFKIQNTTYYLQNTSKIQNTVNV